MDNSVKGIICGKIINTCNEIKALLSTNGAFDVRLEYLKYLGDKLIAKRNDADDENVDFITVRGNHIPIDADTRDPVGGQLKVFGKGERTIKESSSAGERSKSKPKPMKKTKFVRQYNTIDVTKEITIRDEFMGGTAQLLPQVLKDIQDFCGKRNLKGIIFRDEARFVKKYGGQAGEWSHSKAWAEVIDCDGQRCKAEVHWFECDAVGQVEWKVKKY